MIFSHIIIMEPQKPYYLTWISKYTILTYDNKWDTFNK